MTYVIFFFKKLSRNLEKTFTIPIIATLLILSSTRASSYANDVLAETAASGQLIITGLVANPLNLSRAEIAAMPKSTVNAAIICVDFPGTIVAQGNWTGVKLRTLLEAAKPLAGAIKVAFYANEGYSTDLRVETVMRDDVIVAYEKDGEALNALRLVVPGKWGYKWISQLTRIELVDYDFLGFWESRGYSDEASISSSEQNIGEASLLPKNDKPSLPPVTTPETSPSPYPSQLPIISPAPSQPTPSLARSEALVVSMGVVYAVVALVIAVILVAALTFVRKRAK